jgi:hypothetical protein
MKRSKRDVDLVKEEVLKCTQLGLNNKAVKWIIEVAE